MAIKQLTVLVPNRQGTMVSITEKLSEHNINLRALSIAETNDYGVLRLIVSNADLATGILLSHGYILSMTPVTVIEVPDQTGGLAPVLEVLAEGQIDVEYMYSLFTHKEGKAYMVFRNSDEEKFVELLKSHGIALATKEELGLD